MITTGKFRLILSPGKKLTAGVVALGAGVMSLPFVVWRFWLSAPTWPGRMVAMWNRRFDRSRWRSKLIGVSAVVLVVVTMLSYFNLHNTASATAQGDGLLVYGANANATPQARAYTSSSNTFAGAAGTAAGNIPLNVVTRTSPKRMEAVAGYVNSSGTLQVMCYDGTTWTNEWSLSVGGTGTTRRFDIAYESNSGDVMVLYSRNVATTNELGYRTKPGTAGCGTANWTSATSLDPVRTTGTIGWVRMAWDRRSSSNLITAIWADNNADLSAMQWSGTAWGNEPSTVLENDLECLGGTQGNACAASTVPSTEVLDVDYESLSGDVMVAWGSRLGTSTVDGAYYATCTGGTSSCTWASKAVITGMADDATNLDISANPSTDEIVFASIGDAAATLQSNYWSGTAWNGTGSPNLDTTSQAPLAGTKLVSTGWTTSGGVTRNVIVYNDSATTNIGYYTGNGATLSAKQTATVAVAFGNPQKSYDIQMDPYNSDRLMLMVSDTASALIAKRLVMNNTPTFTWTDSNAGASLGTVAQATVGDFSFAYWRTGARFNQCGYGWYANANSTTPGSALAAESTGAALTTKTANARLRAAVCNGGTNLAASSQAFKLQYSESAGVPSDWCSITTGATCNTSWEARRKITFNNTAAGAAITNFPVLVKLDSTRINYSQTQNSGQDLRFVDADNTTLLSYEIEKWDEAGTSYVWVKVPQIDNTATDYINMYYGNASAVAGADATNVWTNGFIGVWHMHDNAATTTVTNSTSQSGINGTMTANTSTKTATGQVDGALTFNGTTDNVNVGSNTSLNITNNLTVSAWAKKNATNSTGVITQRGNPGVKGYAFGIGDTSNSLCASTTMTASKYSLVNECVGTVPADTNQHLYTMVWSPNAQAYVDGAASGSAGANGTNIVTDTTDSLFIGEQSDNTYPLAAILDEVRISNVARNADWNRAEYLTETDAMNVFGDAEVPATLSSWSDVGSADGWCNDVSGVTCTTAWTARRKITFDNSASSSNLTSFPVLVSIDSSRVDYAQTQNSGQDIRFVDPADNTTVLPHEIEKWDETGSSYVWVQVPQIDANSTRDYIWMYYGNGSIADGQAASNVWDTNFKGVWHAKEDPSGGAPQISDSTGVNNGTSSGMVAGDSVAAQVYNGLNFDGTNNYVDAGSNSSLDITSNTLTFSAWVKRGTTTAGGIIFRRGVAGASGYTVGIGPNDGSGCGVNNLHVSKFNVAHSCVGTVPADTSWHYIVGVMSGTGVTAYIDGVASTPTTANTGNVITSAASLRIGADDVGTQRFTGVLDELRISNSSRNADWIKAEYLTETNAMNTFGSEETQSTAWKYLNNATPVDGTTLGAALLSGSPVLESYTEDYYTKVNPTAINTGQRGEWDFALDASNVTCGKLV
jgi:hypothetical protein